MSEAAVNVYQGCCHCGNIRYQFETTRTLDGSYSRQCQCEFCMKHNNLYQSDPKGRLRITIGDPALVNPYRFGHRTADFMICRQCGVMPVVTTEIEGRLYSVVNVNCLEPRLGVVKDEQLTKVVYVDEPQATRLERRAQNWIGDVEISWGSAEKS